MQHKPHHPRTTLTTAHIRQIHIPPLLPASQSPHDTVRPLAHFRRQIRAMLRRDVLHQRVRASVRVAPLSFRSAEQTAVGIPRSERTGRVLIWCMAPRAEGEPVADAMREVDALQELVVRVGGVEVARAAFQASVELLGAWEDWEVLVCEARAELLLCGQSADAVWVAGGWAEVGGDVCVRFEQYGGRGCCTINCRHVAGVLNGA